VCGEKPALLWVEWAVKFASAPCAGGNVCHGPLREGTAHEIGGAQAANPHALKRFQLFLCRGFPASASASAFGRTGKAMRGLSRETGNVLAAGDRYRQ
jgi:hypothetical protein